MQEGMRRKGVLNGWAGGQFFLQMRLNVKVVSCLNVIKSTILVVQI